MTQVNSASDLSSTNHVALLAGGTTKILLANFDFEGHLTDLKASAPAALAAKAEGRILEGISKMHLTAHGGVARL